MADPKEADAEASMEKMNLKEAEEPATGHLLETGWTIWFDKTPHTTKPNSEKTYTEHLKNLGSFRSVEEFGELYTKLQRPYDLHPTAHYHVFREGYMPMWETFPTGGHWSLRFKKQNHKVSHLLCQSWEEVLMGAIGEQFAEPDVVGVVVSVKPKEDVIQIWNRDNDDNMARVEIGEKLKVIMTGLDSSVVLEYKDHSASLKEKHHPGQRPSKPWLSAVRSHHNHGPHDNHNEKSEGLETKEEKAEEKTAAGAEASA
mmetsp:Transcript_35281/g.55108  ORF Transcript_35281/g.55108 Transcript_35281/m.55108 type:complete len:257 (+) Transcript_35281:37-807(+)|eukprot:CAMPEP_0184314928 /NCGR_PEP_ID=MMETSP1049-20130417/78604_1 /TAXON_ID=77928 /ORGANISM="Proteomonas sulcata, Strain CCMP704" /LENGTH=256 /DNA_ID=CAMNT_0026633137 /DNA_START=40 /DNA_END=810 /DNA_ORIENTATION=-